MRDPIKRSPVAQLEACRLRGGTGTRLRSHPKRQEEGGGREAARAGRLLEAFGSGTAVVVQPVSAIAFPTDGGELETIAVAHAYDGGSVAEQILGTIQDIQYARGEEAEHPWSVPVCALEG